LVFVLIVGTTDFSKMPSNSDVSFVEHFVKTTSKTGNKEFEEILDMMVMERRLASPNDWKGAIELYFNLLHLTKQL